MKKILVMICSIIFVIVFWYNMDFQVQVHPNEPYHATLTMDSYKTKQEGYVKLSEIKNNTALIYVEEAGSVLVQVGDKIEVGEFGNVLIGSNYEGNVEIKKITNESVEVFVDVKHTGSFYMYYAIVNSILAGLISFICYMIFNGVVKLVKVFNKYYSVEKRNYKKKI